MASESYLVTGGCGLQGTHIIEKLLQAYPSASIAVMGRNPTVNVYPGVQYLKGDVTSSVDIDNVLAKCKPTVVFHCAARTTIGRDGLTAEMVWVTNSDGTALLLEGCKRVGVKAFIYTGSPSIVQMVPYQDVHMGVETMPTITDAHKVRMPYPASKAAGERHVLAANNTGGMLTCTLRPSALYGERDGGMLYNIMRNYRAGRRRWQIGDGKNEFSQTYAGNSADAHLLAAAKLLSEHEGASGTSPSASSGKIAGEAILITDAYPVPYWDFGREVYRLAGDTTPIEDTWVVPKQAALWFAWGVEWFHWFRGDWPTLNRSMVRFTTMHRTYNITKAKELLGYTPAVDWKEGVRRSVEWYIEDEKEKQQ